MPKKYITMGLRQTKTSRAMSLLFLILFLYATLPVVAAYADPGTPIYLTPDLETTYDGVAPLPSIDTSTSNHVVANNDTVGHEFHYAINSHVWDAQTHYISYINIVADLDPSATGPRWNENSLPSNCIGQFAGAKKVSTDGLQINCRITGPLVTGSNGYIAASWTPSPITPNNTTVDVSFTVSGPMVADTSYPTPINPDNATSNTESFNVVSESSNLETRKWAGPYNINRNSSTGAPESVTFSWGVTFGLVNPLASSVKGANTSSLGSISLNDNFSDMGILWQNAELENCGIGVAGDGYPIPIGVGSSHITSGNRSNVKNAGTFSCSQPGGAGTDISISNTGVDFDATWFPFGYVNSTPAAYYGTNHPNYANEVWDSPIGTNNHAVVSAGYITNTIPWDDILAFDVSGQDPIASLNSVRICNTVSDLSVSGASGGYSEPTSDNSACVDLGIGTGQSINKRFTMGTTENSQVNEYINGSPSTYGSVSPTVDNVVVPGEKLFSNMLFSNNATSINAISAPQMCDVIDNNNLQIVENDFYSDLGTFNTFISSGQTIHDYYAAELVELSAVTGFPSETIPIESDIIVEFAAVTPMTSSSSLRTFNCDSVSSGDWHSDPNDVTGGITNANAIRVRLSDGKNLIPGKRIEVSVPMQVLPSKEYGDIVQNVMRAKSGTTTSQSASNTWTNLTSTCEVYNWAAVNTASNNCDRAIVVAANGHIELTDNVDPSISGSQHRNPETMKSIQAGADWTLDVRATMSYNADTQINDVRAYVVLPEGVNFESATLDPDNIIGECDASANFSCITNSSLRTNVGSTTLVWELGDYDFDFPDSDDPGVVYRPEGFFGYWKVTASTDTSFAAGTKRQARSWLTADNGLATQSVTWPTVETTWAVYFDNDSNGRFDDDWITFTQLAEFMISKSTPDYLIPLEGTGRYDVTYSNSSSQSRTFDFIDILPYNGDTRVPPSSFTGTFSLDDVDLSRAANVSQVYVSSSTSSSINPDPASNVAAGSGIWSCTIDEIGTPGCPTSAQVTAFRVVTSSLAPGTRETVRVVIDTANNTGQDLYSNNAMGRVSGISGEIHSADVYFRTQYLQVGNRVFVDMNDNGFFDGGDTPVEGIEMQLRSADDNSLVDSATTDENGFYVLHTSVEGDYYIKIAQSELASGGELEGFRAQKDGTTDIDSNGDETQDHNARMYSSTNIRSANFTLSNFGEPTGESGDSGLWDSSSNMTLDFALELPAYIGNHVWLDLDDDGVQDDSEPGVGGVEISALFYGEDDALGGGDDETFETTTDSNGLWQIDGPAGTYAVSYTIPNGFAAAKVNQGSDDTLDSDANGVVGSVGVDASNIDFDFGLVGDSSIGDTIFYDVNGNGEQNSQDIGLAGVTVTLAWYGPDGAFGGGDDLVLTDVTDSEGRYLFEGLPTGSFRVSVSTDTLPSNLRVQSADPDSTKDSVSYPVLNALFTSDLAHDFGFTVETGTTPPPSVQGNGASGDLPTTGATGSGAPASIVLIFAGFIVFLVSRKSRKASESLSMN